jgi:hypothetical protein
MCRLRGTSLERSAHAKESRKETKKKKNKRTKKKKEKRK